MNMIDIFSKPERENSMTTLSLGVFRRLGLTIIGMLVLGGCAETMERLQQVGRAPQMSPITNPVQEPDYQPVSLPMPMPEVETHQANSLWRADAKGFFRDQRASRVGDILTVVIAIKDTAVVNNKTKRTRDSNEDALIGALFGLERSFIGVLPSGFVATDIIDFDSDSLSDNVGALSRDERVVREFVLQLKWGRVDPQPFQDKHGVDIIDMFAKPLSDLADAGLLADSTDDGAVLLSREGLLRVDELIPRFYLPEHREARYW